MWGLTNSKAKLEDIDRLFFLEESVEEIEQGLVLEHGREVAVHHLWKR